MSEALHQYWQQILAIVAAIVWGVRLESRASQNSRDLVKLELRLSEQRKEDMETRARDWGRMEKSIDEIRADIKKLLERKP